MASENQQLAQRIIAWAIALSIPILGYLALEVDASVSWPIIIGSIISIALLLDKLEELGSLVESWRE